MSIHHVISEHGYEGEIEHTNADFTGCGAGVSLLDDRWLRAWMAAERIATIEEALAALNISQSVVTTYKSVVANDKDEATDDFRADMLIRPGETLFAASLLEQARRGQGLPANTTETQMLSAFGVIDKRVIQAEAK